MVTFRAYRDGFIPSLGEAELAVGTVGAMRRSHMDLEAKRHFIITNWAIHKLSLFSNASPQGLREQADSPATASQASIQYAR
jgi:hypothetical protein